MLPAPQFLGLLADFRLYWGGSVTVRVEVQSEGVMLDQAGPKRLNAKDREYYARRAAAELALADASDDATIASLHRELYARYQLLAAADANFVPVLHLVRD